MLEPVLNLYKRMGETPLERIKRFRLHNPEYAKSKMSYAGRLDPMAEGVLVVLVGEENKKREKYLNLTKEYTAEVLFGIETDTYDILGKIIDMDKRHGLSDKIRSAIEHCLSRFVGVQSQKYPAYSSKKVEGKPLFKWAREGRVHEIDIPEREIEIFSAKVLKLHTLSQYDLASLISERVGLVQGDFRQSEILAGWEKSLAKYVQRTFEVATITVSCGSGTYIRILAHELGGCLKTKAVLLALKRNSVGAYIVRDSIP